VFTHGPVLAVLLHQERKKIKGEEKKEKKKENEKMEVDGDEKRDEERNDKPQQIDERARKVMRTLSPSAIDLCKLIFDLSFPSPSSSPCPSLDSLLQIFHHNLTTTQWALTIPWADFVSSPPPPLPDVVLDKHTGAKGKASAHFALFASVVPGQEEYLSAPQRVLLRAYERCHLLRDPSGAGEWGEKKRKMEKKMV